MSEINLCRMSEPISSLQNKIAVCTSGFGIYSAWDIPSPTHLHNWNILTTTSFVLFWQVYCPVMAGTGAWL